MREIKFRAWDKKRKKMVNDFQLSPEGFILTNGGNGYQAIFDTVIELMQFTGLKDKNGKEIYEGDVISAFGKKYEVIFGVEIHIGYWLIQITSGFRESISLTETPDSFEIIGNIYENPELLTKGAK